MEIPDELISYMVQTGKNMAYSREALERGARKEWDGEEFVYKKEKE